MTPNPVSGYVAFWRRFTSVLGKPWPEKRSSFGSRWLRFLPGVPFPIRLPNGCLWLARNDACGAAILNGRFEEAERGFVESYLRPGMVVVDIGAHHGFYTLLASRRVGAEGRVISIEPSPREGKRLKHHVRLNQCRNVTIISCALGNSDGAAKLFLVEGRETGCNSLRPPEVRDSTKKVMVPIRRLDEMLEEILVRRVDLIKIDAEGGELEILRGAGKLLEGKPRPVILAEVQDLRTRPWGYKAKEIISYLGERGFHWFRPLHEGQLAALDQEQSEFDGNFVAIPDESADEMLFRLAAPQKPRIVALVASA